MKEAILFIVDTINDLHDQIFAVVDMLGLDIDDKDLHFWIIGIFGMAFFLATHSVFKYIAKYSISCLSFIYTFTVLLVVVFAIEIQQKITNRGNMEFEDVVQGLWGFLVFFSIFICLRLLYQMIWKVFGKIRIRKRKTEKQKSRLSRYHAR